MSNTVWEGSEEALRDIETDTQVRSSPEQSGILKTDEITIRHETPSTFRGKELVEAESFEMSSRTKTG
jgi:hypothetical protein